MRNLTGCPESMNRDPITSLQRKRGLAVLSSDVEYLWLEALELQFTKFDRLDILVIGKLSPLLASRATNKGFRIVSSWKVFFSRQYFFVVWLPSQHLLSRYSDLIYSIRPKARILLTDGVRNLGFFKEARKVRSDFLVNFFYTDSAKVSWNLEGQRLNQVHMESVSAHNYSKALSSVFSECWSAPPEASQQIFYKSDLIFLHRQNWQKDQVVDVMARVISLLGARPEISRIIVKGPRGCPSHLENELVTVFRSLTVVPFEIVGWDELTQGLGLKGTLGSPEIVVNSQLFGTPGMIFAFEGTTGVSAALNQGVTNLSLTDVGGISHSFKAINAKRNQSEWLAWLARGRLMGLPEPPRDSFLEHEFEDLHRQQQLIERKYWPLRGRGRFLIRALLDYSLIIFRRGKNPNCELWT